MGGLRDTIFGWVGKHIPGITLTFSRVTVRLACRVGSETLQISRVGSGRVGSGSVRNLTGRVGLDQGNFKDQGWPDPTREKSNPTYENS